MMTTLIPFIDADPNNPPKCAICNDYGGLMYPDRSDADGMPLGEICDCAFINEDDEY